MPDRSHAFEAYLKELAKNGGEKTNKGRPAKGGRLSIAPDELAGEANTDEEEAVA